MEALQIVLRVLHISAALALGGALIYQRVALGPALAAIDDATGNAVRQRLARRWVGVAVTGIALLLVTGLVNFIVFQVPAVRAQPYTGLYHGLFGLKFLVGLGLFHVGLLLSLPGPRFDAVRARATGWLNWALVLLALIVVLSALLRYLPTFYK